MIVWLASYPRSGNTFIRLLLHHFYGVATHDLYFPSLDPARTDSKVDLADFVGFSPFESMEDLANSKDLAFVKTHELPEDDHPALYVVRDGRDALTSYAHYILTIEQTTPRSEYTRRFEESLRDLVLGDDRFGGWGRHILAWSRRKAPTAIVNYDELQRRPLSTLERAFGQLSLDLAPLGGKSPQNLVTFRDLQRLAPQLFRRGKSGSYSREMPLKIEQAFWNRYGDVMKMLGYPRHTMKSLAERIWHCPSLRYHRNRAA